MTTYEYLNFKALGIKSEPNDPGTFNIDFLLEVAREIPKKMEDLDNMDPGELASRCLNAWFNANELHAKALSWSGWKEIAAQSSLGQSIANSSSPVTIKKDTARSEESYIAAQEKYKTAIAYVEFYSGLINGFQAGHYWAKGKEIKTNIDKQKSGYDIHLQEENKTENDLTFS